MASKDAIRRRQRTVYLPELVDRQLRVRAAQLDTNVSVVVTQALRAYFAAERAAKKAAKKKKLRRSGKAG